MSTDVIDELAGVAAGSVVDGLRRRRAQAREQSQASYQALFVAPDQTGVSRSERLAVAVFVAGLHREESASSHYGALLSAEAGSAFARSVAALASAAVAVEEPAPVGPDGELAGPYGRFPESAATLAAEAVAGPIWRPDATEAEAFGARLTAAFTHAQLLVFRPREASPEALAALLAAGWRTAEVVTLSQLVAFLSYQLRVAQGLRVLGGVAS